jgi:hypothetical protein
MGSRLPQRKKKPRGGVVLKADLRVRGQLVQNDAER